MVANQIGKAFFVFIFFLCSVDSWSTHIVGGDITYKCLGSNQYQVILTVYKECGSDAILEQQYPILYYATDLGINPSSPRTFNVIKQSTTEVQLFCEAASTNCSVGSLRGIQKIVYQGKVVLSDKSSDWRFFWRRAARSEEITTLVLPEAEDFFIEASLNNKEASCNNSPVFEGSPVITVCVNQEQTFNNITKDPDGDDLVFSLTSPKSDYDTEVVFNDGYNATNFMSFDGNVSLNSQNGDLVISPQMLEVGITDFKVEQYRNGKLIGWVKRGIQFTSIDCSNAIPEISDFIGVDVDSVNVCAGETVNYSFLASDADGDKITITQLDGPPGIFATSGNNSTAPRGYIFWNTDGSDVGTYNIVVEASDNVCPQPGVAVKTFTIVVRSAPQFTLQTTAILACDETLILDPDISGGDGNYTYSWDDGATTKANEVGPGFHTLEVTDGMGCSTSRSIFVSNELTTIFSAFPLCVGTPTLFEDNSFHADPTKEIVGWEWDFGDGTQSTLQNPEHSYLAAGSYEVTLTITDNGTVPCSETVTVPITICDPPALDFSMTGQCTYTPTAIDISSPTPDPCTNIKSISIDYGDGNVGMCNIAENPDCFNSLYTYDTPGTYEVTVNMVSTQGCESTLSKNIEIFPSPEVNIIQDDFYLICSNPDSLLQTEILQGGTGVISYSWNTGEETEDITISTDGYYDITVLDEKGCSFSDYVSVIYPLSASARYKPYCKPGDVVSFSNFSTSATNVITDYSWDFDDVASGSSNTSNLAEPSHEFSSEGDYYVVLSVEDSDGCQDNITIPVYNTSIDNKFELDPADEICQGAVLQGTGPSGPHIDYYFWDFDDGGAAYAQQSSHVYNTSGGYSVDLQVTYNSHSMAMSSCTADFSDSIKVNARPTIEIKASKDRFCMYEPITFAVESPSEAQDVNWTITNLKTNQSETFDDFVIEHIFKERAEYRVSVVFTDVNGCSASDSRTGFAGRVIIPDFTFETRCAKEELIFEEAYRDTLENITDYRWDFGDGTTLEGPVPMPLISHKFEKGGTYPVTLTVINSFSGCGTSKTKLVQVLAPPQIDFTYDTICARNVMSFTNLTTDGESATALYQWVFPDGSTSSTTNAEFYFEESGQFPVSLIAASASGCYDTLTRNVYVKPSPIAGVEIPVDFVEAYIPIQFYDDSEGDLVSYYWDFGDGTTTAEADPIHTYPAIEQYMLTHVVTNSYNCSDTLKQLLDLNVYLDIPTAFSPNGDGKNDRLQLIQQGIKVLHSFKIYNRYGQQVFDAEGNVLAAWDGEYNGKPQSSGAYVVHVKASGAYGEEFNFKKNITLLR